MVVDVSGHSLCNCHSVVRNKSPAAKQLKIFRSKWRPFKAYRVFLIAALFCWADRALFMAMTGLIDESVSWLARSEHEKFSLEYLFLNDTYHNMLVKFIYPHEPSYPKIVEHSYFLCLFNTAQGSFLYKKFSQTSASQLSDICFIGSFFNWYPLAGHNIKAVAVIGGSIIKKTNDHRARCSVVLLLKRSTMGYMICLVDEKENRCEVSITRMNSSFNARFFFSEFKSFKEVKF